MADQGQWFKLWCSALDDPHLDALSLDQWARWAKLGALVKRQGTDGKLLLVAPARTCLAMFQVTDFAALLRAFHVLPGVEISTDQEIQNDDVSTVTEAIVSFGNWSKYQGDYSTPRVRRHRDEVKRLRGEEKRGDKKRREVVDAPPRTQGGTE